MNVDDYIAYLDKESRIEYLCLKSCENAIQELIDKSGENSLIESGIIALTETQALNAKQALRTLKLNSFVQIKNSECSTELKESKKELKFYILELLFDLLKILPSPENKELFFQAESIADIEIRFFNNDLDSKSIQNEAQKKLDKRIQRRQVLVLSHIVDWNILEEDDYNKLLKKIQMTGPNHKHVISQYWEYEKETQRTKGHHAKSCYKAIKPIIENFFSHKINHWVIEYNMTLKKNDEKDI